MNTAAYVAGAERVADDLWLLRGRPRHVFNVYVMGDVLVDAATRHDARRILRQVRGLPLRAHVLTHAHLDHMGASHAVCTELGLPLLCGERDVEAAETGGLATLGQKPLPVRLQHRLLAGPGQRVADVLREGDRVGGFDVLEVPGHSPGHVAFWRERDRVLVLGDVLFNLGPTGVGLRLPPGFLTADPATNLESARRLAALDPATVCFGHGPPLREPGALNAYVASLSAATPRSAPSPRWKKSHTSTTLPSGSSR